MYHGASFAGGARPGDAAIQGALRAGARVVAVTRKDAEAVRLQRRFALRGTLHDSGRRQLAAT